MNKLTYILGSVALAGVMTSCYDLDTAPMSSVVTEEQRSEIIESDPSKIDALASGVYGNYNGFQLAYASNFDFGYPALMVQLECRTADYFSINVDLYGWFSACAEFTDNVNNSTYGICRWRVPYNTIYSANQVLSTIDPETEDGTLKFYRGQAYGNRAFAYWFLAQIFQFNYVGHQNDPCVLLITEENQNEVAENGAPRATVQEIYDQILSDLNAGIELMTNNPSAVRSDKRYIDLSVLYGLRARTYLCMGDYSNAAADAQACINASSARPLTAQEAVLPGFNSFDDPNWIWGVFMSTESTHGLYTLNGFTSSWCYGYAYVGMWKAIDSKLWNRIPDADPRKLWWIAPGTRESNAQYYTYADLSQADEKPTSAADYLELIEAPDYAVTKFAPYGDVLEQSNNESDVPLMRIEEMYLILAEAQGMGGNLAQGIQTLENFVNRYRWTGSTPYSCAATSPADFLDEVWFQRRVELWGEGMNYFDLLRLNKPVDRTNSNWEDPQYLMSPYAYYIPAGSPVLLSQIPYNVIDNNPMLTQEDQNPQGSASL